MNNKITFIAKSESECKNFLKIRNQTEEYEAIEDFIQKYPEVAQINLNNCYIKYRDKEMTYQQMSDSYVTIADSMKFIQFNPPQIIIDDSIRASIYFMRKAIECLQFARFFTMKAALLLDIDYNIKWSQGYFPQFLFRCIYFGTATTWYSNAFDHVLQAVYWGEKLYTAASDKKGDPYREDWESKKMERRYSTQRYSD